MTASLKQFREALRREFRDLRRRDRDVNVERAMESLAELEPEELGRLGRPADWARAYRVEAAIARRRVKTVRRVCLVFVAIAAVVTPLVWIHGYTPTVLGQGIMSQGHSVPDDVGHLGLEYAPDAGVTGAYYIRNGGLLPMDLVGVVGPGQNCVIEMPSEAWVAHDGRDFDPPVDDRRAFPVHLAPGRGVYVFVKVRQGRARETNGSVLTLLGDEAFTLRTNVAGVRAKEISLGFPVMSIFFRHPVATMPDCPVSQSGPPSPDERRPVATPGHPSSSPATLVSSSPVAG